MTFHGHLPPRRPALNILSRERLEVWSSKTASQDVFLDWLADYRVWYGEEKEALLNVVVEAKRVGGGGVGKAVYMCITS